MRCARADQVHRRAPIELREQLHGARDVGADQQTRRPRRGAFGCELLVEPQAARLEDLVRHRDLGVTGGRLQTALEVRGPMRHRRRRVTHQHAVIAQQRKQFSRRHGEELLHQAVVHRHPLGMRAGQADQLPAGTEPRGEAAQRAQQLRFFAAHHVRRTERIRAAHAGHDVHVRARRHQRIRQLGEFRRAG